MYNGTEFSVLTYEEMIGLMNNCLEARFLVLILAVIFWGHTKADPCKELDMTVLGIVMLNS